MSRQSTTDLARRAAEELNKPIGRTTVWEILDADAIKPWQYEHWIFPRAPDFFTKAAVVLDLYQGYWGDERLDPFDRQRDGWVPGEGAGIAGSFLLLNRTGTNPGKSP